MEHLIDDEIKFEPTTLFVIILPPKPPPEISLPENIKSCSVNLLKFDRIYKRKSEMNQTFYVCTICRMILRTPFNLRQHKQTHKMREGHTFYCTRCKKVFTSCKYLQRHKELNRCEEKVACSVCKILVNSIRIEDHVLKHYLPDLYKCDFCSKKFNHKCDIKVHIERSHPNGQLICEMCKFKCKDFNKMMKHEKLHIGENLCGCPKCQFQTRSMGKLLKHMQKWKHTNASN